MPLWIAHIIARLIEAYALGGLLFAAAFVPRAILQLDEGLRHSPRAVRLLLFPGIAALWPLFAWRWLRGAAIPEERNAHRTAARHREEWRA